MRLPEKHALGVFGQPVLHPAARPSARVDVLVRDKAAHVEDPRRRRGRSASRYGRAHVRAPVNQPEGMPASKTSDEGRTLGDVEQSRRQAGGSMVPQVVPLDAALLQLCTDLGLPLCRHRRLLERQQVHGEAVPGEASHVGEHLRFDQRLVDLEVTDVERRLRRSRHGGWPPEEHEGEDAGSGGGLAGRDAALASSRRPRGRSRLASRADPRTRRARARVERPGVRIPSRTRGACRAPSPRRSGACSRRGGDTEPAARERSRREQYAERVDVVEHFHRSPGIHL